MLHRTTTPCQFHMWKHAGIPMWDISLHNWTQCYIALQHNVTLTCESMQMYPGQMYTPLLTAPSATELYYTMSIWCMAKCRCIQVRTFCHNTHVNWLKCFHVTTLNNWWSHVEWYLEDSSEIIWWIIFISMNREDMYPSFALNTWCRWWTAV